MDITALLSIALGREAGLTGVALQAGDQLPVRVLDVRADGKVLVDCGRFRAVAEVSFPVAAGEEFAVRVLDARGTLRLEVVRPPAAAGPTLPAEPLPTEPARTVPARLLREVQAQVGRLMTALPAHSAPGVEPGGLHTALARAAELLRPLDPGAGGNTPERLQDWCRNSGLLLEAQLQTKLRPDTTDAAPGRGVNSAAVRRILASDLKAQLAAIVHRLEAGEGSLAGARETSELAQSARTLLTEIVRQQAEITRTADESRQFTLIHFSLPLNAPGGTVRLKVGYPRRRKTRSNGHRAALLVDLDRLGAVRIDLHLADRWLSADLFVRRAELQPIVQEHVAELRETLSPMFEGVRVTVRVSEKKVADFEWEDLRPARAGRLDVRA
jgi:hypothetical protein